MYSNPQGYHDPRSDEDPDTQPLRVHKSGERQRAAIALGVLAIAALVLVGIMVAVLGSSSGDPAPTNAVGIRTGPAVIATGGNTGKPTGAPSSAPRRTATKPTTPAKSSPTSAASLPRNRPVSCPTDSPCTLPDDIGDALGALNAYRTQNGAKPVTGRVTRAAKTCAVNEGNDCVGGYFWEPVGRDGKEVVSKIAEKSDGRPWLLSDTMTSVQIGWAYIPSSQSFECALISNA